MVTAWVITLPSAAVVGALMWWIADILGGGLFGAIVITALLVAAATGMYLHSRMEPVHPGNVNDEWEAPAPANSSSVAV
jgi:PiT family inorganic phosphate transporter